MRERAQPRHVFVDTEVPPEGDFAIGGGIRHHLADVLRVRVGDVLIVRSHCGAAHRGEICEIGRKVLSVRILGPVAAPPSPPCDITVAQAPGKGDRFERVLQHGTEIGVARFIPVVSDRTIASRRPNMPTNPSRERPATGHPSGPEWTAKVDRWRAILRSSAEQAQRDRVPDIEPPMAPLEAACARGADSLRLLLDAKGAPLLRLASEHEHRAYTLLVGPEGGFSPGETDALVEAGCLPASLGPYILRTESAALAASAILMALAAQR